MRTLILLVLTLTLAGSLTAQRCSSFEYEQQAIQADPALASRLIALESFIKKQKEQLPVAARTNGLPKITIPVVVHIIYNNSKENISDETVYSQIAVMNDCYRRLNADTSKTPDRFKAVAADCEIEFQLATSDPKKRATNGIVRKYTPVTQWDANDDMKFTAKAGDDAWDANSYLNIWVCNLRRVAGYSSFPAGPADKDGVVIAYGVFGFNSVSGYEMGKTLVHETGHWLGLRHIWGDAYCGDDWVEDTPKQGNFTSGCPSGIRTSCTNSPDGDMYMNFMDITSDACTNLFTNGQKERMLAQFAKGGARSSINTSTGLNAPTNNETPPKEETPRWSQPNLYPNPATNELLIDVAYDIRWVGKTITIANSQGLVIRQEAISNRLHRIDISALKPGIYFVKGKKEDGSTIQTKFIKM